MKSKKVKFSERRKPIKVSEIAQKRMKALSLFIFIFILSCGVSHKEDFSLQQIAQDSAQAYLKRTIDNPDSYESVYFGTLDSVFSRKIKESRTLDSLLAESQKYEVNSEDYNREWKKSMAYFDSVNRLPENQFKGDFSGFKIDHTFRSSGEEKTVTLQKYTFNFDTLFNVTSVEKVGSPSRL